MRTIEDWAPTHDPNYEVSDHGNVRRVENKRTLKPFANLHRTPHLRVSIGAKDEYVHRLVLEAFVGPAPLDRECLHSDGDPANNHISNLRWGTRSENVLDTVKHGTYRNNNAEKTHCPMGHPYSRANTYLPPRGGRRCKECRKRWS